MPQLAAERWQMPGRGFRPILGPIQRVLDLDLDAFMYGSVSCRARDDPRLDDEDFPAWSAEKTSAYLESACGLTSTRPGFAVEHHGELFFRWRDAFDAGLLNPPFHVTHVDAHADIGNGDRGYIHLLTELVARPVEARREPNVGEQGLGDGNYLAFAVANRWVSDLTYVIGGRPEYPGPAPDYDWRPSDLLSCLFEDFDVRTRRLRLPTLERRNLLDNLLDSERMQPLTLEPPVPYTWTTIDSYEATEPFDFVCLARSPAFTPPGADAVYNAVRNAFIQEIEPPAILA